VFGTADGIAYDFAGPVAVVAYGGLLHGVGMMPPFEFFGVLDGLEVSRVFVRDFDQAWYQRGVRGVGDDYAAVAAALGELLSANGVERAVHVGSSAGGFAAIMFGCLTGAVAVHTFGAETTIDRSQLAGHDSRWDKQLNRIDFGDRSTMLDLAPLVASSPTRVHCHWGALEVEDAWHAARIRCVPHAYDGVGHDLARVLRDRGELRSVLTNAVQDATAL
jgi:pimeloyl-ACP methyl ester carboxylesterase